LPTARNWSSLTTPMLECGSMASKASLLALAVLLGLTMPGAASAQVAAETATILSGTGQGTGRASRSMGSAIAGSMNRATSQIRAAQGGEATQRRKRKADGGYEIPAEADMLEGTDAPTYQLGNGASIRVSGGSLRKSAAATCSENCTDSPVPPAPAPQP
jgi:hypothetical protein